MWPQRYVRSFRAHLLPLTQCLAFYPAGLYVSSIAKHSTGWCPLYKLSTCLNPDHVLAIGSHPPHWCTETDLFASLNIGRCKKSREKVYDANQLASVEQKCHSGSRVDTHSL